MTATELYRLLARFPRVALASAETPTERLYRTEERLGFSPIYIKRDDLNGVGAGGNKIRNLEYLLGEAESMGCDAVIASGKTQSNLCSLAAASCCKRGLECHIVHNDVRPRTDEGNALLNDIFGAKRYYIGDCSEDERAEYASRLKRELTISGKRPYVILNGASTPLGALGYVRAAAELCETRERDKLNIKHVCVPGGNGGLAAGFIFGTMLLNMPFHVHLISVEHEKDRLTAIISGFIRGLAELIGVEPGCAIDEAATIYGEYRFGGWGEYDGALMDFMRVFERDEGILVERVYTGKTLYGTVELIKRNAFDGGVCFLHSGGTGALFAQR